MGYSPKSRHVHRRKKSCPECIKVLEIDLGMRQPPRPPKGPGAGGVSPRMTGRDLTYTGM